MVAMDLVASFELGIQGRTVVVAGAGGGGIGTAVCTTLAAAGATVLGLDVDADRLAITEDALAGAQHRFRTAVVDVRDATAVADAIDGATDLDPLLGLVHVVGGMTSEQWSSIATMAPETFAAVTDLNLQSAFVTTQAVGTRLLAQGRGGSIVHIASVSGLSAMPFGAPYAAAKAGLLALTRTAALEFASAGVRVNAVAAGTVRTAKTERDGAQPDTPAERAAIPLGRRGTPDDIAGAVLYLLSDLAAFVTGHTLVVDGGSSVLPSFLDADGLPVFVHDDALRTRLLQPREARP
jgi:NAD(P)-dependent dehydrogenase (short-subunit alcohol dehydrogenase family)